jgi:hypothetical protein
VEQIDKECPSLMRLKIIQQYILLATICLIVSGCSLSNEETLDATIDVFQNDIQALGKVNTEVTGAQLFLPRGFKVVQESNEYNVLLEHREQTFVLFHNPKEGRNSDINLERDRQYLTQPLLFEEKKTDDTTAYLTVVPEEEEELLVIVGVGGAKLSTLTTYEQLKDDVESMLKIVYSYEANE